MIHAYLSQETPSQKVVLIQKSVWMINPNHICESSLGKKNEMPVFTIFSLLQTQVTLRVKSQKVTLE